MHYTLDNEILSRVHPCAKMPYLTVPHWTAVEIAWSEIRDMFTLEVKTHPSITLEILECNYMLWILHASAFTGRAYFIESSWYMSPPFLTIRLILFDNGVNVSGNERS